MEVRRSRIGGFVVALGVGVALANGHGVAWAEPSATDSTTGSASSTSSPSGAGPTAGSGRDTKPDTPSVGHSDAATTKSDVAGSTKTASTPEPDSLGAGKEPGSTPKPVVEDAPTTGEAEPDAPAEVPDASSGPSAPNRDKGGASQRQSSRDAMGDTSAEPKTKTSTASASAPTQPARSESVATVATAPAVAASPVAQRISTTAMVTPVTAAVSTAVAPAPVSPIAEILSLPARIINGVLGLVGVTPAAGTTPTPISPAPLVQLLWEGFRRFEDLAGLNVPPAVQPVLNSGTFTGSLTTPTPTVSQFLNASTAAYVLGGTPAGLKPFTVDGFPVQYANTLTGTAAQVWVTPQNQVIIAYQGTTGGTNLLFNPLIAVTQVLADAQAVLTGTTPLAFTDALRFADAIRAEAAEQGYAPDGVFVTGHSLGAWQAQYVAQNSGLAGIGFEGPGLSAVPGNNGANSLFVNVATYGDPAAYFASDLPGFQPFAPPYVAGGGTTPHYGPIVLLGDPASQYPLTNAAALVHTSIIGDLVFAVTAIGQFLQFHLPSVQAYSLDVNAQPALLPGSGTYTGPVYSGFGDLTIPKFLAAASAAGILFQP